MNYKLFILSFLLYSSCAKNRVIGNYISVNDDMFDSITFYKNGSFSRISTIKKFKSRKLKRRYTTLKNPTFPKLDTLYFEGTWFRKKGKIFLKAKRLYSKDRIGKPYFRIRNISNSKNHSSTHFMIKFNSLDTTIFKELTLYRSRRPPPY